MVKDKSLKDQAIDIKGKAYVLVADRVIYFNDTYPNGSIQTEILSSGERVEMRAIAIPDIDKPERKFIGHSQAVWGDGYINKTSALENCETSAVGRALALMGIGVIDSIASVDEIKKAESTPVFSSGGRPMKSSGIKTDELSPKQKFLLAIKTFVENANYKLSATSYDEVNEWATRVAESPLLDETEKENLTAGLQKIITNINAVVDTGSTRKVAQI